MNQIIYGNIGKNPFMPCQARLRNNLRRALSSDTQQMDRTVNIVV